MIEIMIASIVIIVGIMGIIALFPISIDVKKDAYKNTYAADAAELFLHFNASEIDHDWTWIKLFPEKKSTLDDATLTWSNNTIFLSSNIKVKFPVRSNPNEAFDPVLHNNGIFILEQYETVGNNQNHLDFAAIMRTWKTITVNSDGSEDAQLNVEISWPKEKPYAMRSKQIFNLEVFKMPQTSVTMSTWSSTSSVTPSLAVSPNDSVVSDVSSVPSAITGGPCDSGAVINVNPMNCHFHMFTLETPAQTWTIDHLRHNHPQRVVSYNGPASTLYVRAKANGNGFMLNGVMQPLGNNDAVLITGDLQVSLYNSHPNHPDTANAMGHWYICVNATNARANFEATNPFASSSSFETSTSSPSSGGNSNRPNR